MSWPQVKLESVFDIARGGSPRPIDDYITDDDDGLNWISIKDASNSDKYITTTKLKIKPEGLSKTRLVKPGDFLLTNSMSFGRPYIMKTTGCIHDGWLVLSGNPEIADSDYFYHLLGSEHLKRRFSALAAGAVVKNLNIDLVKGVEIPLPPLAEQKRIAAILDKADAVRRKRQQAIQLADDFLRAVFLEMFGDPVTNPKGFRKGAITELADVITGQAFKSDEYIGDSDAAVRLCRGTNTLTGYFDWSDTAYWPEDKLEGLEKYLISDGDVILAMDRPWISSGLKVCIFSPGERSTYLVQRVARLRPKNKIFSDYIYSCVKSDAFERHCCPTETTIPHISPVELRGFEVLIPKESAIANYHEVVSKVRAGMKYMQDSSVSANDVFSSLSQRAFSGRL
ncbi:restriction endonuclease subunit S [Pseudomonas marginalis]|uniref:restriction endonuclease subunit S n=1 Tax=Pseudomonas marginalis TaxID=298 RepID=UPI001F2F5E02|nr:restriction endonuclease subunit S [Pseudomonas marginalis]MCF5663653.1 restriction endonuclease subunit S [Pseudomonas marginalis]